MVAVKFEGIDDVVAALDAMILRVKAATENNVRLGLLAITAASAKETPVVRGTLRRSIRQTYLAPISGGWEGHTAPTVIYARRIHEGYVGKTDSLGRTFAGPPPNRYMMRGVSSATPALGVICQTGWGRALTG